MKIRFLLTMTASALVLAACNKDQEAVTDNWNGEIRLSSGIIVQSRSHGVDTQIAQNEKVSVYIDGAEGQIYGNNVLTADGSGLFSYQSPMFYPSADPVDIYAIHSNPAPTVSDFPTTPLLHSVEANQLTKTGYAVSDLLYAVRKQVAPTSAVVPLAFYHLLSKVEIVLKSGNGNPDLTGATVTIENTKLKAEFTPNKGAEMDQADKRGEMVNLLATGNDVTSISIPTVITDNFVTNTEYAEAIVIPQELVEGSNFIRVTLPNAAKLSYKIPAGENLKLESGKKYTYYITVNLYDLIVESSIADWETVGSPRQGSAFLEE